MTAGASATEALGLYYDRLSRYLALAGPVGHGGGSAGLSMHRALAAPGSRDRPSPDRIDDLILERWPLPAAPRVLDAGCGLGGTVFRWQPRLGGAYTGITLSGLQCARAAEEAERRGIAAACRFEQRSYDTPPVGPFDAVVAIESLAHSPDPATSIAVLSRVLAPEGVLILVDDVPEPAARDDRDFATFRAGWRCPAIAARAVLDAALAAAGLSIVHDEDLTGWVRPRSLAAARLLSVLNRGARAAWPSSAARMVLDSHHGGLALERLYRRGLMRYRLIIARG